MTMGPEYATMTMSSSNLDFRGHSSMSNMKFDGTGGRRRRRPKSDRPSAVNFYMDTIKIIEVEHMDDLPGEEIWYSRDEYEDIKTRNSNIVRMIKAGEFEENDEYSCRGLEHKLKEVFRQRRANKFNALNAVLEEQDRQINRGINDDELVCSAYRSVAAKCQESANTIGVRDYRYSYNYDPDKPATGIDQPLLKEAMGDNSQSSLSRKDKKKKKKDKKEVKAAKKEQKKLEKKEKKMQKKEKKLEKKLAKKQKKLEKKQRKAEKKLAKKLAKHKNKPTAQTEEEDEDDDDDDSDSDSDSDTDSDESENEEEAPKIELPKVDPPLSPDGAKKPQPRRYLKGGRRIGRRMSM